MPHYLKEALHMSKVDFKLLYLKILKIGFRFGVRLFSTNFLSDFTLSIKAYKFVLHTSINTDLNLNMVCLPIFQIFSNMIYNI